MSPAGLKPSSPPPPATVAAPTRPLHRLGSYCSHATLHELVRAHFGEPWADGYDTASLAEAARDALNRSLNPHGLVLGEDEVFYTNAKLDDDSDLVIGRALAGLDIAALAAGYRLPATD